MSVPIVETFLQDVIYETKIGDVPDFFSVMNRIIKELAKERQWRYYITDSTISVLALYDTGTVAITEGSGTVTGTGTTFTSAMVGRKFRASNGQGIYDITGYTSATSITISPVWPYDDITGNSFQIYQDTYDFPTDLMYLIDIKDAVTERPLDPQEYFETLRRWESFVYTEQSAIPPGFAWPWEYAQFGWNSTTKTYQVVVNAVADAVRTLDVIYRRWPTSVTKITDYPDIPEYLEEVLRLRLFKHFVRRRNVNNEVELADRRQRLQEWMGEEAVALYTAKTADGMLIVPYLRNRRVLV